MYIIACILYINTRARRRYVLARNNLGLLHRRLGRPAAAAAEWRRALAADPGSPLVLGNLRGLGVN
jgi:Flp pilus assembly protein TadD